MPQKNNIRQLLNKYRKGQLTGDELKQLEDWYLSWQPEEAHISTEEVEAIKHGVWQSVISRHRVISMSKYWYAAATILIVCTIGGYYWLSFRQEVKPKVSLVHRSENKTVLPGRDRAMLTLSNGKTIELDNSESGRVAQDGSSIIDKTAAGQLNYSVSNKAPATDAASAFNTLSTPRGGQYQLVLPDGTRVWLNAASSITFPVQFAKNERVVTVRGEAYFEVSHRNQQPFRVLTSNQEIKVFGTHFNVSDYPDDRISNTTLVSGSVQIKSISSGQQCRLKPGQQASVGNSNGHLTTALANVENAVSWKKGYFLFDNQHIKEVMRIMSRWYDVDVAYQGVVSNERFGGSFSRNLTMNEILSNFERLGQLDFEINGKRVIVKSKSKN